MVSYFVSEQPTVERSLVAGPPGHRATLSSLSLTYNVRPVGNVANQCLPNTFHYICLPPGDKYCCSAGPQLLEPAGSDPEVAQQLYLRP